MALGHFAYTIFADHKVVHALLPVGGPLTHDERAAARSPGARRPAARSHRETPQRRR